MTSWMNKNRQRARKAFTAFTCPAAGMAAFLSALPAPVAAQTYAAGTATTTIGGMIATMAGDAWRPFWILLLGLGFLGGLWLIATGLMKLRDIGGHGHQGGALDGCMRIAGGALLVGLPDCIGAGIGTFYSTVTGHSLNPGLVTIAAPQDCTVSTSAVTCVVQNVATNVAPVAIEVIFGAFFLCGAVIIARAVQEMATSHSTRGQSTGAWGRKIMLGALMCNVPYLFTAIENTLGISNGTILSTGFNNNSSLLAYSSGTTTVLQQYTQLIGYIFTVLVMFGVIAFWRGIQFLRAASDGNRQGGSVSQGLTFCIGGVALANAKWTTCIVLNTFVGAAMGFCS